MAQAVGQQKDRQEKCSICAFYYAIAKGASLEPKQDSDLEKSLLKIYPNMPTKWYIAFLKQAKALIGYLNHTEGSKDNSYLYAWYDGTPDEIPSTETTTIINSIWDNFSPEQKRIFGSKKDSWNTVDVYLVKKTKVQTIKTTIKELDDTFNVPGISPEVYIGTINALMCSLLKSKDLIPVSLKQVSVSAAAASLKETNLDVSPDIVTTNVGNIVTPLKTNIEIFKDGNKLNFNTNSLTTNLDFTVGAYTTNYFWETRMSGTNQKTELKDKVVNTRGGLSKGAAQAGSIPVIMMKRLVSDFGRYDLDAHLGAKFSETDKTYWKGIFKSLVSDRTVKKDFGAMTVMGKSVTPDQFIDQAFELDSLSIEDVRLLYKASKNDFSAKLRQKLRQFIIIDTFIQAKKNGKLADFIAQSYYRAAKMNLSQADLSGPFIKISG